MAAYSTPASAEGFGETAGWECAVASAETIGAPESGLQQAYTGALSWHELTSVGFGA
jgi:hypothetical protein